MSHTFHTVNRYQSSDGQSLPIRAPLHVRSCGHYLVGKSFRDNPLRKNIIELYWGIQGTVRFRHDGKDHLLKAESVFFFLPGDKHDITVAAAPAEYCWFTLDGDDMDNLIRQFGLRQRIYPADSCPLLLFRQLEKHMHEYTLRGDYLASATAYEILCLAVAGPTSNSQLFNAFKDLVVKHFANPLLTVGDLARQLKVHRTTLNRCLEAVSNLTPLEYLTAFRLNEAVQKLRESHASIKEIAQTTGFSDPNYFAKVIRKRYGRSPSQLRTLDRELWEPDNLLSDHPSGCLQ